ncbi:hypothetical protein tb265_15580 [Gemmatimonadetes bacterium T265]|nr:hypothetical protein tb265_15580 [Gemmatimonadetes bacterium T265]
MDVYILDPALIRSSASTYERACYDGLVGSTARDRPYRHRRVSRMEHADLILAPVQGEAFGPHFLDLRTSAIYHEYRNKLFCYCPDDRIYPTLPGVYPAATPFWAKQGWVCGGHYISSHIRRHGFDPVLGSPQRHYLFSFVGSSWTHRIRAKLLQLRHPRALLVDSSASRGDPWYHRELHTVEQLYERFREGLSQTKFALCPRGVAASSIRLFEAMEAGCVPVVIADDIVLPTGPEWDAFCVRVPEANVDALPTLLESLEERFETMSTIARATWEAYFSPEATFDSIADWSASLLQRLPPGRRSRLELQAHLGEYALPSNLRTLGRHAVRRWRGRAHA